MEVGSAEPRLKNIALRYTPAKEGKSTSTFLLIKNVGEIDLKRSVLLSHTIALVTDVVKKNWHHFCCS